MLRARGSFTSGLMLAVLGVGPKGAGHLARLSGVLNLSQAARASWPSFQVHLARQVGRTVVFLRDGGGAKGVGLDQVGTRGQVALVDVADHVGRVRLSNSLLPFTSRGKSLNRSPAPSGPV